MEILIVLTCIVLAVLLMFFGLPVAIAFGIAGIGMMLYFSLPHSFAVPAMFAQLNSFILMAIPFFIFAGGLMSTGGISKRLIDFANSFVGHIRGGLGHVTIVASMLFGSISGSSAATVSSIGMVMLPQMERYGYPKPYTTGLIACSGLLGQLIPPSIPMIIFGMITGASVAGCFLSTVNSGLVLVILYCIINYIQCRRTKTIKTPEKMTIPQFLKNGLSSTKRATFALFMPVLVLGGIYGGVFTATEAGCMAAVYALLVGTLIFKEITYKGFLDAAAETASIEGAITFILCFIFVMGKIFTYKRIPDMVADTVLSLTSNRIIILLFVNLILGFMGMIVDDISNMLLTVPLFYPLFLKLGIHPFQMAAIFAVNQGTGQLTPPVATNLYVAARVSGLNIADFFKYCLPFLIFGNLPVLFAVTFIPEMSLWLPKLVLGKL